MAEICFWLITLSTITRIVGTWPESLVSHESDTGRDDPHSRRPVSKYCRSPATMLGHLTLDSSDRQARIDTFVHTEICRPRKVFAACVHPCRGWCTLVLTWFFAEFVPCIGSMSRESAVGAWAALWLEDTQLLVGACRPCTFASQCCLSWSGHELIMIRMKQPHDYICNLRIIETGDQRVCP